MTTVSVLPVPYPRIEVVATRAWWAARFLLGLTLELLRGLWRALVWFWGLPRENQGVLAVTMLCVAGGTYATRQMLADPRTWAQVFGPPGWAVGIVAALFIARRARRPIVLLVPFGLVLWWFSPRVALVLVAVVVVAVRYTTTTRTEHGRMTSRRTLTGATEATAHFAPSPGKQHCPQKTAEHEGGHGAAAVAAGGYVVAARAFANGSGWCKARLPVGKNPFEHAVIRVAFYAGGEVAVHSKDGCGADQGLIRANLEPLDPGRRPMARTAGYAQAHHAQHTHGHIRRKITKALVETGSYR
jgi:hypothetical protein